MASLWNPWRGCHKCSEGCEHCYIHKGDQKRGVNTNEVVKTKDFFKPIEKKKNGEYKVASGLVYLCFSTDFFVEDADSFRRECFEMMKTRSDLQFLFLTKRIERFYECIPEDWEDGYENVTIGCTVENQKNVDRKLSFFNTLPIRHKMIICQPLLERVNIEKFLDGIELVVVGGESDKNARVLDYDWVLDIREQCLRQQTAFEFRQCGTNFIKDKKTYVLKTRDLASLARKANINIK